MMRAVGLSRRRIFRMVMIEGASIGVLGVLLAIGGGLALGIFWVKTQFAAILGFQLDLHVPWTFLFGALVLAMLLCVLGSILPSSKAARLEPAVALRYE